MDAKIRIAELIELISYHIVKYHEEDIKRMIALGVDAIIFGDDSVVSV